MFAILARTSSASPARREYYRFFSPNVQFTKSCLTRFDASFQHLSVRARQWFRLAMISRAARCRAPNEFEGLREIELSGNNGNRFQSLPRNWGNPRRKNGAESLWRREWSGRALAPLEC